MEALFLYLLKASGLIAVFYLAYHFLVRKETFFDGNRWFLLGGLLTSALLPLFFIKKVVYVVHPKMALEDLVLLSKQTTTALKEAPAVEAFDWIQFIWFGYTIMVGLLVLRILLNLFSLFRMLHKQQLFKREGYTLVDLEQNISPFSFFNYIVYNSDYYTEDELKSIILHEQVHSKEWHSFDILLVKLFTVVFWFNPLIWLYKKAIAQNLEYIADQKAIQQMEDRQAYQHTLLKVVSHQNCLSITNHFYQSLIKKRIVMLNKNQSNKRNSWKYALVIPALVGFVLLFQIKVIAQEKEEDAFVKTFAKGFHSGDEVHVKIDKNSSDEQLKREVERLNKDHGVTLKVSKVKRNSAGEITCIKVSYKDKDGKKGATQVNGEEPIAPIHFYKNDQAIGFGVPKRRQLFISTQDRESAAAEDSLSEVADYAINIDVPNPMNTPDIAEAPEEPESPEAPEATEGMKWRNHGDAKIIIKKDGKKPLVIINGKVMSGDESLLSKKELEELKNAITLDDEDGEEAQIIINGQDMGKIRQDAMRNANIQIKRMRPQIKIARQDWKRAQEEMEKAKPEMEKTRADMEASKPEMLQAKEEMLKAKAEMVQAKAELEKERARLKKGNHK